MVVTTDWERLPRSHSFVMLIHLPPLFHEQMRDLGSNFFLAEPDVGKPRASACAPKLAELNSMVTVRYVTSLNL